MRVSDLMSHVRNEVLRDHREPGLYGSDALMRYLNEGLAQMARRTHVFTDDFELVTKAGTRHYDAEKGTIHIQRIFDERGVALPSFTRKSRGSVWQSRPTAFTTDSAQRRIMLHPVPDDEYKLRVVRAYRPEPLTAADEVPLDEDRALLLAEWMAYRALQNNDPDASQTINGEGFHERWLVGLRDIKRDVVREAVGDNPSAQPRQWT